MPVIVLLATSTAVRPPLISRPAQIQPPPPELSTQLFIVLPVITADVIGSSTFPRKAIEPDTSWTLLSVKTTLDRACGGRKVLLVLSITYQLEKFLISLLSQVQVPVMLRP